jgi:uncharacterized protein (DUF1684 family)
LRREAALRAENGWLAVAGLFWLDEGVQAVGSAAGSPVRFPDGTPPRLGTIERRGRLLTFRAEPGVAVTSGGEPVTETTLRPDTAEGGPTVLQAGRMTFSVIERGGRYGVRLRDPEAQTRRDFQGLAWFPVNPAYRVAARFTPHAAKKTIRVANVLGTEEPMETPGVVTFRLQGRELTLEPVLETPDAQQLFFIFRDPTAPKVTYGGGRYLYTDLPKDGAVELDFNKAYSPPCAFTAYATCPLPPRQNRLPVRIEAGEKNPPGHH